MSDPFFDRLGHIVIADDVAGLDLLRLSGPDGARNQDADGALGAPDIPPSDPLQPSRCSPRRVVLRCVSRPSALDSPPNPPIGIPLTAGPAGFTAA